jgi:hypothetical protein
MHLARGTRHRQTSSASLGQQRIATIDDRERLWQQQRDPTTSQTINSIEAGKARSFRA